MDNEQEVFARHLLVCKGVHFDPHEYGAAYSLANVCETIRPADELGYPLVLEQVYLFTQLFGTVGTHLFRVQLVRIDDESDAEEVVATYGPLARTIRRKRFVSGVMFPLWRVEFPESGYYDFRLFRVGQPEPLVSERLFAQE